MDDASNLTRQERWYRISYLVILVRPTPFKVIVVWERL